MSLSLPFVNSVKLYVYFVSCNKSLKKNSCLTVEVVIFSTLDRVFSAIQAGQIQCLARLDIGSTDLFSYKKNKNISCL